MHRGIRTVLLPIVCAILPTLGSLGQARAEIRVGLYGGAPINIPTSLRVSQTGEETLHQTARYETRPLERPLYYAWRISRWCGTRAWGIDFVHDKIYLSNPPDEIARFSISHGFNILSLMHLWELGHARIGIGAGPVIAHPESTVRGETFGEKGGMFHAGYYWTGPAFTLSAGRVIPLHQRLGLDIEMKLCAARGRVPIASGSASLTRLGLHFLLGLEARL